MEPVRLLEPPDYTAQEREALIDFVLALRKSHIRDFVKRVDLPVSGTKPDLRSRLQEALREGQVTYAGLRTSSTRWHLGENSTSSSTRGRGMT